MSTVRQGTLTVQLPGASTAHRTKRLVKETTHFQVDLATALIPSLLLWTKESAGRASIGYTYSNRQRLSRYPQPQYTTWRKLCSIRGKYNRTFVPRRNLRNPCYL